MVCMVICLELPRTQIFLGIPIALRLIFHRSFIKGPFHLGSLSLPIATIAVLWIFFIAIVFVLPQINPVTSQTLNYAVVAVGIVVTYCLGYWFIHARRWFKGPVPQIRGQSFFFLVNHSFKS